MWSKRAAKRKVLVNKYLWNEERGMFFDYDFKKKKKQHSFVNATTVYPLWAGLVTEEQAAKVVENALPLLEQGGGIAGSTEISRGPVSESRPARQWDYPNGWVPHQMLAALQLPKKTETKTWLKSVFRAAIKDYYTVWMSKPRLTETGLSRYYGSGLGAPPEVEEGHFDAIYKPYADHIKG